MDYGSGMWQRRFDDPLTQLVFRNSPCRATGMSRGTGTGRQACQEEFNCLQCASRRRGSYCDPVYIIHLAQGLERTFWEFVSGGVGCLWQASRTAAALFGMPRCFDTQRRQRGICWHVAIGERLGAAYPETICR